MRADSPTALGREPVPAAKPRLIVIGNGMAAVRTLEELLQDAPDDYQITVFGAEPHGNYNRILLSPVLAGEKHFDDIITHPKSWYAERGITLHCGDPVVAIDRQRRTVQSANGLCLPYDRLLLATGSKPFVPPMAGTQLPGVVAFRDIGDVDAMLLAAKNGRHAVVIGGGLLGLEAANGLLRQGLAVTVVHVSNVLMERQLDAPAATLLQADLERRGLRFLMAANTTALLGDGRVQAVAFADGSTVPADLVVMAAGVRPNIALAQAAGLHCERAIVVDDTLQTLSDPRIYAVGECVQHRKTTFGLVAPVWEQARVCAAHLAGFGHARYRQKATATKLKVTGVDLYSAGDFIGGEGTEDVVYKDYKRGIYKRLVLRGDYLVGAVLYGDVKDGPWYFELMQSQRSVAGWRSKLVFGQNFCRTERAPA
jgi:nitrite reductase (NADH) large subunit